MSETPLTTEARAYANKVREQFEKNLKTIAEEIADSQSAEAVLVPHVDEAFLTLKRAGLRTPGAVPRFYQRSDFWVGIGTFLIGLSLTISSFARDVLESTSPLKEQPGNMWVWMISVPAVVLAVGCFMAGIAFRIGPAN